MPSTSSADSRNAASKPTTKTRLRPRVMGAMNTTVLRSARQPPRRHINFLLSILARLRALRPTTQRAHPLPSAKKEIDGARDEARGRSHPDIRGPNRSNSEGCSGDLPEPLKRMQVGVSDNEEGDSAEDGSRNYAMGALVALMGKEVRKYAMGAKTDHRCFTPLPRIQSAMSRQGSPGEVTRRGPQLARYRCEETPTAQGSLRQR